jgi:hypothetical protein
VAVTVPILTINPIKKGTEYLNNSRSQFTLCSQFYFHAAGRYRRFCMIQNPGLVLTKVTLLENGQAALNGLRFGAGTRGSRVRFHL